jgi:hypothetical protein
MSNPKTPTPGDLVIDASDVHVVDITPEQISKLTKLHAGADKALDNIERLKPAEIQRAGINPEAITRAIAAIADYRRARALLPAVEKLLELLRETQFQRGHDISRLLGEIATQARRRGDRDPHGAEILGPLADLLAYQYGPANKGAATRRKKKAKPTTQPQTPADPNANPPTGSADLG